MPDREQSQQHGRYPGTLATQYQDGDPRRYRGTETPRRSAASFDGEREPGSLATSLQRFTRRHGWRAYAIPALIVITIAALLTARSPGSEHHGKQHNAAAPGSGAATAHISTPPVAQGSTMVKADKPGQSANTTALKAAALPPGPAFTKSGDGTFRILKGTSKATGSGHLYRYSIEVENGITGINLDEYAQLVQSTLADKRSWSGHGVAVQRVDSGHIDFHVTLVSMMTVRNLCGYTIPVETSCYIRAGQTSSVNRVVFDNARWVRGATAYLGDLQAYRIYMINHEDGHAMGHNHAHECLSNGYAPAMMQQTIGLTDPNTGKLCAANPWPYPPGVKGAPGAEQLDTPQNSEFRFNGD